MKKPAIVIVAYNRPNSLNRILESVYNADYFGYVNIPLVISIDGGGPDEIQYIAKKFDWRHGNKHIIVHKENLGLRKHIILCGDLTSEYENVIILEDDLFLSPQFYDYAYKATDYYKNDEKIAGVSLYSYRYNGHTRLPFIPSVNGLDTYFLQIPSSLGQTWTHEQWKKFKLYYENNNQISVKDKLPDAVKKWPESSWKKYFYKYIIENNLFFVYPYYSFSTCLGDAGTHFAEKTNHTHTPIPIVFKRNYVFAGIENNSSIKYDAYFELLANSFEYLGFKDICVDLYGEKQLELYDNIYWLTSKECIKPIKTFGFSFIPLENNIYIPCLGNVFFLVEKKYILKKSNSFKSMMASMYYDIVYKIGFYDGELLGIKKTTEKTQYRWGRVISFPFRLFMKTFFKKRYNYD